MERKQPRNEQKENNEVMIVKEFLVKLKNKTQWERWVIELRVALGSIIVARGVPLTYVICDKDERDDKSNDWEILLTVTLPLVGTKYTQDKKLVHQITPIYSSKYCQRLPCIHKYQTKNQERK